ncbi:hypothetical protein ACG83_10335 [Frankia sp. R43]|uniref:hypothetical protein n=1 Tax=Frankia sp. R43 TaxID=269536 RepID=UPI0006CA18B1|nr:hypothetical protein [Frankia sp. R43]KPM55677.1 hypothetical protein ACG83_10335 [Frankia sp. R43]
MNPLGAPVLGDIALDAMARAVAGATRAAGRPYYSDPAWMGDEAALRREADRGDLALYHFDDQALAEVVALDFENRTAGAAGDLTLLEAS